MKQTKQNAAKLADMIENNGNKDQYSKDCVTMLRNNWRAITPFNWCKAIALSETKPLSVDRPGSIANRIITAERK